MDGDQNHEGDHVEGDKVEAPAETEAPAEGGEESGGSDE